MLIIIVKRRGEKVQLKYFLHGYFFFCLFFSHTLSVSTSQLFLFLAVYPSVSFSYVSCFSLGLLYYLLSPCYIQYSILHLCGVSFSLFLSILSFCLSHFSVSHLSICSLHIAFSLSLCCFFVCFTHCISLFFDPSVTHSNTVWVLSRVSDVTLWFDSIDVHVCLCVCMSLYSAFFPLLRRSILFSSVVSFL